MATYNGDTEGGAAKGGGGERDTVNSGDDVAVTKTGSGSSTRGDLATDNFIILGNPDEQYPIPLIHGMEESDLN